MSRSSGTLLNDDLSRMNLRGGVPQRGSEGGQQPQQRGSKEEGTTGLADWAPAEQRQGAKATHARNGGGGGGGVGGGGGGGDRRSEGGAGRPSKSRSGGGGGGGRGEGDGDGGDADEGSSAGGESSEDDDSSWITWFCSLRGNEFFCELDEDYIQDGFNLTGLSSQVPYYENALDMILDADEQRDDKFTEDQQDSIEAAAEMLYGLIHARYILTGNGLADMCVWRVCVCVHDCVVLEMCNGSGHGLSCPVLHGVRERAQAWVCSEVRKQECRVAWWYL